MKIRGETVPETLSEELQQTLESFRDQRGFEVSAYVDKKVSLIDAYFSEYGLESAVVAVSGGIDSAVVLGLLDKVSSIKHIVPVLIPASDAESVSNQREATALGKEVCEHFGIKPSVADIGNVFSKTHSEVKSALESQLNSSDDSTSRIEETMWARGQLVPYLRTPVLYYHTTLLTDAGSPAVLVGTTNYSEGGYLGYIGKASDGMVDLQVISDIYKSEVYQVAEFLGLPESVIDRPPTGDMHEDISDEEVFGATYDFVELFMENKMRRYSGVLNSLSPNAREEYKKYAESLEAMYKYNKHKYLGASPAVHLDVIINKLNVWTTNRWMKPQ